MKSTKDNYKFARRTLTSLTLVHQIKTNLMIVGPWPESASENVSLGTYGWFVGLGPRTMRNDTPEPRHAYFGLARRT